MVIMNLNTEVVRLSLFQADLQFRWNVISRIGCPHAVMVKTLDCRIAVREFEPQSRYYVYFQTNTFGKGMNPLILSWAK